MYSQQPLPRPLAAMPTLRRPMSGGGRPSGLYGEVMTLPLSGRGLATDAERKTSL